MPVPLINHHNNKNCKEKLHRNCGRSFETFCCNWAPLNVPLDSVTLYSNISEFRQNPIVSFLLVKR